MAKTSPSQLRTKSARISRQAYAILSQLAIHNGTSVADELDKILSLEQQGRLALNNYIPLTLADTKKLKLSLNDGGTPVIETQTRERQVKVSDSLKMKVKEEGQ